MCLSGKSRGGPNVKAPGTEASSEVLGQPSPMAPKDGPAPEEEEKDGSKAPLRTESGNVTSFFPSRTHSTSLHPAICSLNSYQELWEMGIFGDAAPSPCPLAASGQDPHFWGTHPLPACRALTAVGLLYCKLHQVTRAASFKLKTFLGPLAAVSQHCTPFPWRGTSQLCPAPAPPMQEGNSWRWRGQKHHIWLCWGWQREVHRSTGR